MVVEGGCKSRVETSHGASPQLAASLWSLCTTPEGIFQARLYQPPAPEPLASALQEEMHVNFHGALFCFEVRVLFFRAGTEIKESTPRLGFPSPRPCLARKRCRTAQDACPIGFGPVSRGDVSPASRGRRAVARAAACHSMPGPRFRLEREPHFTGLFFGTFFCLFCSVGPVSNGKTISQEPCRFYVGRWEGASWMHQYCPNSC